MTGDTILLVGRAGSHTEDVLATHADRLERRTGMAASVALYEHDPVELADAPAVEGTAYAVPATFAHTRETATAIPRALARHPSPVRYCDPPGRSSTVTSAIAERAAEQVPAGPDATLVLAGFGSSSGSRQRRTAEYHAARLRERGTYGEVVTCYLIQNPTVECARYNVSNDRAVVVPLFLARTEATEDRIPAKLDLDRGGLSYGDPLGEHPLVTDAVAAEVARQRALADADADADTALSSATPRPVATDGRGDR